MAKRTPATRPLCVVLLSGGLDSAVLLATACERFGRDRVVALSVDYGQTHRIELEAAERIADQYGVERVQVAVPLRLLVNSSLTGGTGDFVVPGRNTVFIALAVGLCESRGGGMVWIGSNKDDHERFPDCRGQYIAFYARAVEIGTGPMVSVAAPFVQMRKAEVVAEGRRLGVPIWDTVSCYDGTNCGECYACKVRARSFAEAEGREATETT